MSRGYDVPDLHQQDGGLTMQAFADREGLTLKQALTAARSGQILGAQQDGRSKRWWVYPPAKLLSRPRSYAKRSSAAGFDVGTSPHGLSAGLPLPVQETRERSPLPLSAKPLLTFGGTQPPAVDLPLPVSGTSAAVLLPADAAATPRAQQPVSLPVDAVSTARSEAMSEARTERSGEADSPGVYRSPETRRVCQDLREAAARQHREGIHYLRLDGCEFSRLYAALDHERSRIRKLVGKGLVAVGKLRATDSVWQKMQAMCQEGRLL